MLAPGEPLGAIVRTPELQWAAQAIPFYDYLLEAPEPGALIAGGPCIRVRLPQAGRLIWHKLYAATQPGGFPEKAAKDQQQALVLAAAPVTALIQPLYPVLVSKAGGHALLQGILRECLAA